MDTIANDYTINIATANGTGSQSANLILLQSLFEMGVPVSGKNLFPSNISGLPTWYIVRLSDHGYQAPGDRTHIQVLVNPATWEEDLAALEPGSVVIWNENSKKEMTRDDVVSYPVPMMGLARKINPKIAKLVTNIIYVGVLAEMLGIDQGALEDAVAKQFKGKASAIELNINALGLGRDYFKDNFTKEDPYVVEAREIKTPKFFIDGNEAAALGCIFGGVQMLAWYPITPSSSLAEGIINYIPQLRVDDEGNATCAVIQAEDELAAAGMVLGAGWAGGRGMTATSGPGISLMQEFIGLAYFAEISSVFWDVNRVGPSTGLPTRTQQSDITLLYEGSHGDTQHIVLIPGTVEECFEFGWRAFDYTERFQTPVFGLSDLDLGMNRWACEGFTYPDQAMDRGKVVRDKDVFEAFEEFGRYLDVDGDGIPYRTLPGSGMDPILYRGTGHNPKGVYSEKPEDYLNLMNRLKSKINGARDLLPAPIIREESECEVGIIYLGSMENTIQEIDDMLEATGLKISQCRVRALPLHSGIEDFIRRHEHTIVLEINRDGQLYGILRKELPNDLVTKVHSVAYSDGMPPRARIYADQILSTLKEVNQ
ncbi:2-oxoacid:acceptor oxidoreductase subunit alpha [Candidatus Poseidoniales archaeon]|jgi:2-oxoglutarate ferredoxin oxidoreductase subunit alpha|nr:MAG: putative pyruvate:ferredoxin oxidoreductase, alpha and gamma subunits [uncultured Candidatus Poseidoniales archaeon]MBT5726696.1 2-oxoacid:acceptor oxidoreductase subunit alpha [Euryarchaeota archaeon]MDA8615406.1 2-oxoacid:acceptor oxidoreductase subunit alpha [Candidatus Poseidoniales archaeon]MDB0005198.1 2-oxoacid:acceptor oxidoreductase subunit alpha [Candidatus Poseidoniaceae archaeon]MDB2457486.1 2-oxoacid:acceptor oxidoreductase subunit alpha [bacterium]